MKRFKFGKQTIVFVHDLVMVSVAWLGAFSLRFNLESMPVPEYDQALAMLPVLLPIQGVIFLIFGLYRGVWRFASIPDLIRISKSIFIGVLVSAAVIFLITRMENVPRSVFPIYGILLLTLLGGPRFLYRWIRDGHFYRRKRSYVLLVGAGEAGEMLARNILRDPERIYVPVAFVDDKKTLLGKDVHGIRVMGGIDAIPEIVKEMGIDLIVVALPAAAPAQMRRVVDICSRTGIPFRTLPRMQDLLIGQATVSELREVSIEDLLGREPVNIDWDSIHDGVTDKVVLVTGGGGSIGSELCNQLVRLGPAELIILEHSEYNLYTITKRLRSSNPETRVHGVLGSVADSATVEHVMDEFRPKVVFHVAAYKHVQILQSHVREAVKNNILGTKIMAEAADRYGCEVFATISTDKAVNPESTMGATKRVAEIFCHNFNTRSTTRFITVRFGNVLDSAGSVVPLFREIIKSGGPLVVTHPEVSRYFMTIPEACQLVLQATLMGQGGEIFVLDMGEPIKINDLAEEMIRLSGKVPGEDIEIIYSGLLPGEKLHEELFHEYETPIGTANRKILLARSREFDWDYLLKMIKKMEAACKNYDEAELYEHLGALVPNKDFKSRQSVVKPLDGKVIPLVKQSK